MADKKMDPGEGCGCCCIGLLVAFFIGAVFVYKDRNYAWENNTSANWQAVICLTTGLVVLVALFLVCLAWMTIWEWVTSLGEPRPPKPPKPPKVVYVQVPPPPPPEPTTDALIAKATSVYHRNCERIRSTPISDDQKRVLLSEELRALEERVRNLLE